MNKLNHSLVVFLKIYKLMCEHTLFLSKMSEIKTGEKRNNAKKKTVKIQGPLSVCNMI